MVASVNPTLDLTIFEAFKDDFELEKIDYGYKLKLALSREQYKEFRKMMLDDVNEEALAEIENEYPLINKFEMEISIDGLTYFVSNFKMTLDTTAYSTTEINGNFTVSNKKSMQATVDLMTLTRLISQMTLLMPLLND